MSGQISIEPAGNDSRAKCPTVFCVALLAAGLAAVLLQCYWGVLAGIRDSLPFHAALANVLGYFTILTNLLVAITLLAVLFDRPRWLTTSETKTAVLSYILVVGFVYEAVLRQLWDPRGLHKLVDTTLHDVVPIGFLVFWFFFVTKGFVRYGLLLRWTIYPIAYLLYSTVRGAITGFSPYPFIDFSQIGWARWAVNVLVMVALFVGVGATLITLDKALARSSNRRKASFNSQLS